MSKKKSYMDLKNVLNEGFFDNLLQIFNIYPKLNRNKQIKKNIVDLNSKVANLEQMMNDEMKEYGSKKKIKLNKFKLKDFIKGV